MLSPEKLLPLIVSAIYLMTGICHARQGNWAAFGMWASYSLANVFIIAALENK